MLPPNPLFTAWLIDPYTESIQAVELTDSLFHLGQWTGTTEIGFFLHQPSGERAIMNNDAFTEPPLPPAWQWVENGSVFYGRALWVFVSETGQLQTPACSRTWLAEQVVFQGFVDISELATNAEGDGDNEDEEDWKRFLDELDEQDD